ncbi:3-phosphoserine/phosphohydroxythreonine transaminase [Photobacterium sp. ZSDE20]|uniref:Phosphoserine aminotransferase n=1 Tax=Photobacterium pectinilyticum TaxID=2906793 RepID=A0ABT1N7S4_9GAMM|nr:3-phosphoserine/phosphohydroxythreonine transaminase [Photobacterium sp. ZSDE20]MCQ1060803.1 3-phosphoserine/phosphohydroxythreonine transaminase [Photobacterium sp. ZSDE20]MDD1828531.1 3-phosphoserine/phosphohydroxythreonine transaminase [Photobacterium sp. ZSDE20]
MNNYIHPALIGSLSAAEDSQSLINFSPGPTSLPKPVEENIKQIFNKKGLTSLALSHRSPEFIEIINNATASIREVMLIPNNYEILFTHAGGHGQFAAVPLNLCQRTSDVATYIINGTWSARAENEAKKYCQTHVIDGNDPTSGQFTTFPDLNESDIDPDSKYIYLCSNETVNGIELHRLPTLPESRKHIPLIVDASSDFSTKPIDWDKAGVGVLFACASKNIGHPGLTVTIVRKDLLDKASPFCPEVFNYTTFSKAGNLWNTPATFNIEVVGFLMAWIKSIGGVNINEQRCIAKAKVLYDVIDGSKGFYSTPVENKQLRSRMNVPFNIKGGDEKLTNTFLIESWEAGMVGMRTLTPFGVGEYLRASLYNSVSEDDVLKLVNFMKVFAERNND